MYYTKYVENPNTGEMEEIIEEKIEIDPKNILAVRVPKGVSMYPIPMLQQAILNELAGGERLPLLAKSG